QILSVPYYVMIFLAAGLRFAAVLPGDLRASWIFDVTDPDRWRARAGLWRVMFLVAVLAPQIPFLPVVWPPWSAGVAGSNLIVGLTIGALLIEVVLWRTIAVPCAEAWRPRTGHLRVWWPAYFFAFLIVTNLLPALALLSVTRPLTLFIALGVIALGTVAL